MTTLARRTFTVTDSAGNVVAGASVEVRSETIGGAPLATLYSDRAGTMPLGNPFTADANGVAFFHTVGDDYKVRAYLGPSGAPTFEQVWRYVPVGMLAAMDNLVLDTGPLVLNGALTVNGSSPGSAEGIGGFRDAAMAPGNEIILVLGRDESNFNRATLAFHYGGLNSPANYGWLGLYGQDRAIKWDGQGFVGIGTGTTPLTKLFQVGGSLQASIDSSGNIATSGTISSSNGTSGTATNAAAATFKSLGLTENLNVGGVINALGPLTLTPSVTGAPATSGTAQAGLIARLATNPGSSLNNVLDIGGYGNTSFAMWLQVGNQTNLGSRLPLALQPLSTGGSDGVSIGLGNVTPAALLHVNGSFLSASATVASASASVLAVGLNGATNPAFQVDASTASQAAGLKITGAATGATVALAAIDSGSNTNLTINAKGTGTIGIGSASTGLVTISPALSVVAAATLQASLATQKGTVAVANGLNSNITKPANSVVRLTGPTGVFSIGGFTAGSDGMILNVYNTVAQTMTIVNEDASSTAGNRIKTLTGGNVVLRATATSSATFIYDSTDSRWVLIATN